MSKNRRVKRSGGNRRTTKKKTSTTAAIEPEVVSEPSRRAPVASESATPKRRVKSAAPAKKSRSKGPSKRPRANRVKEAGTSREIVGIVGLGATIFVVAALISLQAGSGLLMGPLGRTIAVTVYGFAGVCSYVLAGVLVLVSIRLLTDRMPLIRSRELAGLVVGLASLTTLIHLIGHGYRIDGHAPGGAIGEDIAEILRAIISTAGTALLAALGLIITVVIGTPLRMRQLGAYATRGLGYCWRGVRHLGAALGQFCGDVIRAVLPEREHDEYLSDEYDEYDEHHEGYNDIFLEESEHDIYDPPIIEAANSSAGVEGDAIPQPSTDSDTERVAEVANGEDLARAIDAQLQDAAPQIVAHAERTVPNTAEVVAEDAIVAEIPIAAAAETVDASQASSSGGSGASATSDKSQESVDAKAKKPRKSTKKPAALIVEEPAEPQGPQIVESEFMAVDKTALLAKDSAQEEPLQFLPLQADEYQLPPVHLLDYDESQVGGLDREAMLELSAKLTTTLESYGVRGQVVAIRPGPVVTMYEFAPAPGTRINKIANLSDDLAMSLEALRVRIVAPIPGKAAVGIEVPNKTRETVYLKEIIADEAFQNAKYKLPLAMGKDIEGAPRVVDLAKMPHLLVAGTTGSGKSVAVNSMITSLLYNCTPDDVRMIMVDPKMLELSIYEGVPHLLLPVVTDPKKANLALRWGVDEMERRYDLLAKMGVRDLASYNKKSAKLRAKYEAEKLRMAADEAERLAEADDFIEVTEEREPLVPQMEAPPEHLPYIVIIIDEFADLMMCAPKEVETSVARIAQKARAAGIHLVLATQRPSVDVITGLIKANFPSRAAFRVTSKVDSRTILDQGGAEALLGAGDMLFSDRGMSPVRFHGCFVGEEEISAVVDFLRVQGKPSYNLDIIKPREDDGDGGKGKSSGGKHSVDAMYDSAVAVVAETQQVSISMIQRRLRIGYNRAARIVEEMEKQGVVSTPDHTNKREVLIGSLAA